MKQSFYCPCCKTFCDNHKQALVMPFIIERIFGWIPTKIDPSWELNSIENGILYFPCNTCYCSRCGHLFPDIRFDETELNKLYEGYRGEIYNKVRSRYEKTYISDSKRLLKPYSYLNDVENYIQKYINCNPIILDWGGDTGINTPFKHKAKRIDVFDVSEVDTLPSINQTAFNEIKHDYDLIVCAHVLEHVSYPDEIIAPIKKIMNEGTILYVEVPFENIQQQVNDVEGFLNGKRHWHEHINFFSSKSLKMLLEKSGLNVINITQMPTGNSKPSKVIQAICNIHKS